MQKYFYCYSSPLKNFFITHGERFIDKSIHERTHKKYWLFEGNENLNKLLIEWRNRK